MSYLEEFMQQWKAYLIKEMTDSGLSVTATQGVDNVDIKANSLAYFRWLRTTSTLLMGTDESRDLAAWVMLEKQLTAKAKMAERGTSSLVSKLYIEENQVQIHLNFSYDEEQHIVFVS